MVSVPSVEKNKQMETPILQQVIGYWWIAAIIIFIVSYKLWLRLFGVIIIPDNHLGLVNKKFVLFGSNATLPDGKIIALKGEAGYQADTLPPGLHIMLWPWQYEIIVKPFLTIPQGKIGVVQAHDGKPLHAGRILAQHVDCDLFQNARAFLEGGGQRGSQISVMTPGTYRINDQAFKVQVFDATEIADGQLGIVTTLDGQPLNTADGEIAGKLIGGHNLFQDGHAFIANGGYKGLQEEPILAGTYYFNPLFIKLDRVELTAVEMAHVGVVMSFVGEIGQDVTGDDFKHADLFDKGKRGVWQIPLNPGRYPINPHTHKVEMVPTASIVLNWADAKNEAHKLDERLSTIHARSKDGFEISLDVSQIIHVSQKNAAKVIARFGSMHNLVSQVLEPLIGNYFRNAVQESSALDFYQKREENQKRACAAIREKLKECDVEAVDTLIGDLIIPDELLKTQTDRQIAQESKVTYIIQQDTEKTRIALAEQTALANTQAEVVAAQRRLTVAEQDALTANKKAEGEANATRKRADATAYATETTGEADAKKIKAVGKAEADVIQQKQAAIGAENYTAIEVATRLSQSVQPLVPTTMLGNGEGGTSALLNMMAIDRLRQIPAPAAVSKKDTFEILPTDKTTSVP